MLSACTTAPTSDAPLTLVETKSPVQLLRNEAVSRVPAEAIDGIVTQQDGSTACRTIETDPKGLERSFRSTVRFELKNDPSVDPQSVIDELAASFVDDGWKQGTFGVATIIELTRPGSETKIHISMSPGNEDAGTAAAVQLAVSGPCVMTAGTDSAEVRDLES
jgi:hypothetical protein